MAGKSRRGFAAMDEEQRRTIARMGGRAAHQEGTAHEFDSAEATEAGRKGGRAVSQDREHMAAIGRRGGLAAHRRNGTSGNGTSENGTSGNGAVAGPVERPDGAANGFMATGGVERSEIANCTDGGVGLPGPSAEAGPPPGV